jgi:hypothetical protein
MAAPLAPVVLGPLVPTSIQVAITNVLFAASVEVFADGEFCGGNIATGNGVVVVSLQRSLSVGEGVTATQTVGPTTSPPSNQPVPVTAVPSPLPTPIFASPVSECMRALALAGLVPGATVTVEGNAGVLASIDTPTTSAWVDLDESIALDSGEVLRARQSVSGATSAVATSPPLARIIVREGLPAPVLHQPLRACEPSVLVSSLIPTSDLDLIDANGTRTYVSIADAFWANGQLEPGTLSARQRLPRCGGASPDTNVTVGPATAPPAPILNPFCPEAKRIVASGLKVGGVLTLWSQPSTGGPRTELGAIGIGSSVAQVDLPEAVGGSGPIMRVVARQTLCELEGPEGSASEFARSGSAPPPRPKIVGPLHDCLRAVPADGLFTGVLTQAWSVGRNLPLSDLIIVPAPKARISTWFPLPAGDKVEIRQFGCGAPSPSATEPVRPVPSPLPAPTVIAPVRPGAQVVPIRGVLPGARAALLVDGQERAATDDTWTGEVRLWLPTPLHQGERLWAVQRLCSSSSPTEGEGVVVTKGRLSVEANPVSVPGGRQVTMTVRARDTDTGAEIPGLRVLLGGVQVGVTGTAFAWTAPGAGSSVGGTIKGAPAHHDAAFSIALRQAIAVQLTAWPVPILLANRLVVRDVAWTLTTQWGAGTIGATGASTTAMIPPPPGASGNVDIGLTCTVDAAGDIDGYQFERHTIAVNVPAAATVALSKPSHAFSFQLLYRILIGEDPEQGQLSIWVKYFGGS